MPNEMCLKLILALGFSIAMTHAQQRRIYAAGSGLDMLSQPETVQEIITLSTKETPAVLYLGTATYDDPSDQEIQTQGFINASCTVTSLNVAWLSPSLDSMRDLFEESDIVLVSGGNTLFARDRWVTLGIDTLLHEAMEDGTVLCGGSAGGIVWFDGGHSDSMEAASYKNPPGPFLNPNMPQEGWDAWSYIRVPGIATIPGFFCPHYDVTESNGVPRSADFTTLLQQHSGEVGIGVDNWAALMIDGDSYTVISRENQTGSVAADGSFAPDSTGKPGAWTLQIDSTGCLVRSLIPSTGLVDDILTPATFIVNSSILTVARAQNPDDGMPADWNVTTTLP